MNIYRKRLLWKVLLLMFAVVIGLGSLIYTHDLVDRLKEEERKKAEQWAEATRRLVISDDFEFLFSIIEDNTTVPVILIDEEESIISQRNLPAALATDTLGMVRELKKMAKRNDPISIELPNGIVNQLYYRESTLLRQLRVYPYVQFAVILLFIVVAYVAFSSSRMAEQNQVWVGMAKETAHQLGTPLSSMVGWIELLKLKGLDEDTVKEIEKDVQRLEMVTDRFSKIGSVAKLEKINVVGVVHDTVEYIRTRISAKVAFEVRPGPEQQLVVPLNRHLFEWVIENLCKNAVDAMECAGKVLIEITDDSDHIHIDVSDTGKGIPKSRFKTIFRPGFTSKARGWGLGLTLTKRIVENYHSGKIYVKSSTIGKGTTFRIILKK